METSTSGPNLEDDLPAVLNLIKYTAARSREIKAMRNSLLSSSCTKLAFQKLPKHMRRRVMSHNANRLPRRLREIHINQLKKSGAPLSQKKPSRKHRRRPRNLLAEYERRRRRIRWLETHIWHAKRFHMVEKWGYKLADRPCDKAFRACYRATTKHCLLQDISYYGCIEIKGPSEILISELKSLSDSLHMPSIGARAFRKGTREGETVLYKNDGTKKAIGVVNFMWKPSTENISTVWLWAHAAYFKELLDTLVSSFKLKCNSMDTDSFSLAMYANDETSVELFDLTFEINRFRLTGPLSHAILQKSLQIVDSNKESEWFKSYLDDENNRQSYANQKNYWKVLGSVPNVTQLPPRVIVSLVVVDPRFNFPQKRTKAITENGKIEMTAVCDIPEDSAITPLWNKNLRGIVKDTKVSNAVVVEQRSQLLVPGSHDNKHGVPVPVILIQRPGSKEILGNIIYLFTSAPKVVQLGPGASRVIQGV